MTRGYEQVFRPEQLGMTSIRPEELSGGASKEEAAAIFDHVLQGTATKAQTQCVLTNAAFAIQVMEPAKSLDECLDMARESLESGNALNTLKHFIEINS